MQIAAPFALLALLAVQPADSARRTGERNSVTIIDNDRDGWISVRRHGQPMLEGSGRMVSASRPAGLFTGVLVKTAADVEIVVGSQPSIEVRIDDNLVDRLTTRIVDDTLEIDMTGSVRTRTMPQVRITVPRLAHFDSQGSGDVRISGVDGGRLNLASHGSSDFVVEGRADRLVAALYGSGQFDLTRVRAPDLSIAIYGAGTARAHAAGTLDAAIYGSGTIEYGGAPTRLNRQVFGSGSIRPIGG